MIIDHSNRGRPFKALMAAMEVAFASGQTAIIELLIDDEPAILDSSVQVIMQQALTSSAELVVLAVRQDVANVVAASVLLSLQHWGEGYGVQTIPAGDGIVWVVAGYQSEQYHDLLRRAARDVDGLLATAGGRMRTPPPRRSGREQPVATRQVRPPPLPPGKK